MVALIVARKVFRSVDVFANILAFRASHDLFIPSDESIVPVTLGIEVDVFTVTILLGGRCGCCCRCCCRCCCWCCCWSSCWRCCWGCRWCCCWCQYPPWCCWCRCLGWFRQIQCSILGMEIGIIFDPLPQYPSEFPKSLYKSNL